jgi:predicted XRE-type DNA-binding protein
MSETPDFTKLVPGFDFLQSLVKNASSALPSAGQWVAPTLDPDEIDKRIGELRTVQFWLEQNARMLATTIQALEVQRMTLSTLKNMNVQMADLRDALTIRVPEAPEPAAAAPAPTPAESPAAAPAAPAGVVDPMQWWGALTRQFTELAANAMRETTAEAGKATAAAAQAAAAPAPAAPAKAPSRAVAKAPAARKRAAAKRAAAGRKRAPAPRG